MEDKNNLIEIYKKDPQGVFRQECSEDREFFDKNYNILMNELESQLGDSPIKKSSIKGIRSYSIDNLTNEVKILLDEYPDMEIFSKSLGDRFYTQEKSDVILFAKIPYLKIKKKGMITPLFDQEVFNLAFYNQEIEVKPKLSALSDTSEVLVSYLQNLYGLFDLKRK